MGKIKWDDSLSVKINLIDTQHKMLIQRLSDLSEAIETSQGEKKIIQTLAFLIEYTEFHFSTEEKNMKKMARRALPGP